MMTFKFGWAFVCVLLINLAIIEISHAGYRKTPLNGSIFGKRSNQQTNYGKKIAKCTKCFKVIITSIIFLDGDEMLMICQAVASMIPTCSPWLAKMTESIAK